MSQRTADVAFWVLLGVSVVNYFSPVLGLGPRVPELTYMLVALAGIVVPFMRRGGPRDDNDDSGGETK